MVKKLLIIDDGTAFLKMLQWRLTSENLFDVKVAKRPLEALDILDHESFDLVVSDIKMPEMSGYDLCKAIRSK